MSSDLNHTTSVSHYPHYTYYGLGTTNVFLVSTSHSLTDANFKIDYQIDFGIDSKINYRTSRLRSKDAIIASVICIHIGVASIMRYWVVHPGD